MERLGIMVTRYDHFDHIAGVLKAARAKGHPVYLFLTDEGVRFASDPRFKGLLSMKGVEFICCEHSCLRFRVSEQAEGVTHGSQLQNAIMLHDSARILIF